MLGALTGGTTTSRDPSIPTPSPAPTPDRENRVRVTSIAGALASIAIVVAFFLPWVEVREEDARHYRERLETRLRDPLQSVPPGVNVDDWRRLARLVADQQYVSGLDVFYWARTAKATADAFAADSPTGNGGSTMVARGLHVAAVALAVLPVVALLLAVYFVVRFLRGAHSPALILAVLDGALAIAVLGTYGIVRGGGGIPTRLAGGLDLLGVGGGVLFLAGVFGVRLTNWWRVFGGAVLVGGSLALLAWGYVSGGPAS